jgi:hypothetical protein
LTLDAENWQAFALGAGIALPWPQFPHFRFFRISAFPHFARRLGLRFLRFATVHAQQVQIAPPACAMRERPPETARFATGEPQVVVSSAQEAHR